jgi:MOSC domain-containing protein YiiM
MSGTLAGMTGTLVAVCAVAEFHPAARGGLTAIDKRPLTGPVAIEPAGVAGDRQIEDGHGGTDQALYAYSREEAARWADELGRDIPPGTFGENLAVTGMPVTDAVIGERWRIGATVLVEVTTPRTPCVTFKGWMGEPQWVKRFGRRGDVGSYLRVLTPGLVRAGDPIEVVARPAHGVTARDVFNAGDQDPQRLQRLLDESEYLAEKTAWRVRKTLAAIAVQ